MPSICGARPVQRRGACILDAVSPIVHCVVIASCLAGAGGCSLVRSPILASEAIDGGAGFDAGAIDGGAIDSGGSPSDAPDAPSLDTGPPDVGPLDTGPPDAGPPDAGPSTCDSQYATAVGYVLCGERAAECEFVSTLEGVRTCGTTCAALGGRCLDAYRNELPFPPCERQGTAIGCDVLHQDDICICSRGP